MVSSSYARKAGVALIASSLLIEPFAILFSLFAVVLTKFLGASALQIALFTMLKPAISLLSFYWSRMAQGARDLRSHLALGTALSVLPFLVVSFEDNVWLYIAAAAVYLLFSQASPPALMEILKANFAKSPRENLFSLSSMLSYGVGVGIGLGIGVMMDSDSEAWRMLFFAASLLVLCGASILRFFPLREQQEPAPQPSRHFIKDTIQLLRSRPDFAHFQWGFMIAMVGLMLAMPAVPFFLTSIKLSFVELMLSLTLCKGLGFVAATPLWNQAFKRYSVYQLSCAVCVGFGLFYCALLSAAWSGQLIFAAYGIYGVVQAGSHMLWNWSGPLFSGQENSLPFSSVNVLMVGLRGLIVPPIGALCCELLGTQLTIGLGMLICFYGGYYLLTVKPMMAPLSRS